MSTFNFGSLFIDDVEKEKLRSTRGSTGYITGDGGNIITKHFKKKFVDTITPVVKEYERLLGKKGETFSTKAIGDVRSEAETFTDFGLENMREGYAKAKMKEATALREQGIDTNVRLRNVTSLSDAQKNRQARIQSYRQQKRALEAAESVAADSAGASLVYSLTEYDRDVRTKQYFYDEFDSQVNERREAYAQEFGLDSYKDAEGGWYMDNLADNPAGIFAGTGILGNYNPTNAGKQDIDTFVISDMLGMSYEDISRIFLMEGDGIDREGTEKSLDSLRESFATIMESGVNSINKLADSEDEFRAEAAEETRQSILKDQARQRQETSAATQASIKDLKAQMRAADQEYKETESYLNDMGMARGGGPAVDIQAGRPE